MWRVGSKVPINVYDGDRPVCQCHSEQDAALIVMAANALHDSDVERLSEVNERLRNIAEDAQQGIVRSYGEMSGA